MLNWILQTGIYDHQLMMCCSPNAIRFICSQKPRQTSSSGGDPVHGRLSRARVSIVTRRINGGYQYILLWDIFWADNFLQAWWSVPTFTSLDKIGTKHKTGVVSRFIPRFPRWDRNLILRYPEAKERPSCLASSTTPRGSGKMGLELRRTAGLGGPWSAWSPARRLGSLMAMNKWKINLWW